MPLALDPLIQAGNEARIREVLEKGFRGKRPKTWVALTPEGRAAYEAYRKALLDLLQGR